MAKTPATAEPKRRWYRFSLRTVLVGVAAAAILCGYVANEYRTVQSRKAWRASAGSEIEWYFGCDPKAVVHGDPSKAPGLFRCWLGDEAYCQIAVYPDTNAAAIGMRLFPEADVYRWRFSPSQLRGEE